MLFHLSIFDSDLFMLLLDRRLDFSDELISDVGNVGSSFAGANGIHEGHLVEEPFTESETYLPTIADYLEHLWLFGTLEI